MALLCPGHPLLIMVLFMDRRKSIPNPPPRTPFPTFPVPSPGPPFSRHSPMVVYDTKPLVLGEMEEEEGGGGGIDVFVCVCVCVCVCERERECVCERERERERGEGGREGGERG